MKEKNIRFGFSVIYQNERYDDWLPRLAKIKQVLVNYKEELLTYHKKKLPKIEADKMPNGTISCAADGNFLETLNLSLSGLCRTKSFRNKIKILFFCFFAQYLNDILLIDHSIVLDKCH